PCCSILLSRQIQVKEDPNARAFRVMIAGTHTWLDAMAGTTDLTLLVCTYNRRADVLELLASIVAQQGLDPSSYEVLVVDNNSNDDTPTAVERFIAQHRTHRIRYLFEGRQGKTNALETGIRSAAGEFLLVIDSDQLLPPGYVARVLVDFRERPDVDIVGGRVLPRWSRPAPRWLTVRHWSAMGMTDYG